ncbi:trypsin-3-like isoform X1 [Trachemys scripta elegans]|uniref:trypsin-3-like isoform X1 n=1 Tax=Trachemys scripta elegans TaxID=31138 RepID=UPI00155202C5|nr:trypsin-3-like isoform X1 [Trachemys scripta elegans]
MNYLALGLLLSLQFFSLIDGQNSLQRIIGGYIVAPHSSKYLVSLKRKTGFHFCGGSLVSRSWVLTAAHCKTEINQMMIVAGEYSLSTFEGTEQIFRPSRMVVHPDYSSASKNADIMLIKLNRPLVHNAFVSIVPLPQQGAVVREGRFCQVSGWGYTTPMGGTASDTLRSVRLPIISSGKCNSTASYAGYITKNMICAGFNTGGKDACQVQPPSLILQKKLQVQTSPLGRTCPASAPAIPKLPRTILNGEALGGRWVFRSAGSHKKESIR